MSSLGATIGLGGNGADFKATNATSQLANPVGGQQAQDSITAAQGGIGQQQAFLNALQGQNGIGNQSSVYNQLQGVANGTGPNPAQAMLNQSTGQNVANQAALMAGQRGASQNAGLIARQAAQQGANTQQQAVGQGATMQANQSLNALGQLGSLANQQVAQQQGALTGLNSGLQGEQGQLLGQLTAQNNNVVSAQNNANSVNGQMASTNAQSQAGLVGGITGAAGSALTSLLPAALAKGGVVPSMYADGGITAPSTQDTTVINSNGPKSAVGKHLSGQTASGGNKLPAGMAGAGQAIGNLIGAGIGSLFGGASQQPQAASTMPSSDAWASAMGAPGTTSATGVPTPQATYDMYQALPDAKMAEGGKVPALVSPGERYLNPREAKAAAQGKIDASKSGEKIPGKAKVKGNSYANDTVPKTLEAGGLVIPKSVMESKNPSKAASAFVAAHMNSLRKKSK
jgi:hypothetical protein